LHSHISQFQTTDPQWVWTRVVDFVQSCNQNGGTITRENLPEDLLTVFKHEPISTIPEEFNTPRRILTNNWVNDADSASLSLVTLTGSWNEKNECDKEIIEQLVGNEYNSWLKEAQVLLQSSNNLLTLNNGVWKVKNRSDIFKELGSHILDHNLESFKSLAIDVLQEPNPSFDLPVEDRFAAAVYGKKLNYSNNLREGIAEGLAIIGNNADVFKNCSHGRVKSICRQVIHELLSQADWIIWASLQDALPNLAEAAPDEFLDLVEKALHHSPCPFDELFAQEGDGFFGQNYLTGLLWALEGLAWEENFIVRVCVTLGELASHDPGGKWSNRPINSLATILLPWKPQTFADINKRNVAIQTLFQEFPEVAWNLIFQLLPNQRQTTFGTYKPRWKNIIPEDFEKNISHDEYWQQIEQYTDIAIKEAGHDPARLSILVEHFDNLPELGFKNLIEILSSSSITSLPETQRLPLWENLTKLSNKHRQFVDANWVLPDEKLSEIEDVAQKLAPNDPFNLHRHLFTNQDIYLYDKSDNWKEKRKKLDTRRDNAIKIIFQKYSIDGVIQFSKTVDAPEKVGSALGSIEDKKVDQTLFPQFLNTPNQSYKALVRGYIWRKHNILGWDWCDNLNKSRWKPVQVGQLLALSPFTKEAWDRASEWLGVDQRKYWSLTSANPCQANSDLTPAIKKLIEFDRPFAAIDCMDRMKYQNEPIDPNLCVKALLAALSSDEPPYLLNKNTILELIGFLQSEPSVEHEDLISIEWAYLPLFNREEGRAPILLERELAKNPDFFCDLIQLIYHPKDENRAKKEPSEIQRSKAINAWNLLHEWKTLPGSGDSQTFDPEQFNAWLKRVKTRCIESGHLEIAMLRVGGALINAPSDPDGLWIHKTIASILNDTDAEEMREGFITGLYNSRGVHSIVPSGEPENELARKYEIKAENVENAGYHRLAIALRKISESYKQDAFRIIDEYKDRDVKIA
jgi:hypothetical protein